MRAQRDMASERQNFRFRSAGRALRLTDKVVGDTAAPPLATRPRRCSASAAMAAKGQLPAYRRWADRLLGADFGLPAAVIKSPPGSPN